MKRLFTLSTLLLTLCTICFANAKEQTRKTVISLQTENDLYFSDRYYTNGLKLNYTDPGDDWWTSFLQFKLLRLFADSPNAQSFQTASLGQDMYVGYDITIPNPPLDDRPYAGWLYLSSGAHIAKKNSLDSFTITLGIIGPQSYAADIQKAYHTLIDADRPMGWDNQLKNEPGIILSYTHYERLVEYKFTDNFRTDFIGALGGNLGNVNTEGRIKFLGRIGFNMPYSFDMSRIDANSSQDIAWDDFSAANWHFYFYYGAIARFVAQDITLDGNTFTDSRSVDKNWFVGELNLGISARYENFELGLNVILRSEDFKTQRYGAHAFWSAVLKYSF